MVLHTLVIRELDHKNISHRVFIQSKQLKSLEQATHERNQQPDQVVRSIIFRIAERQYVMVLVAGSQQIAWPALRKYLGTSRISTANQNDMLVLTGYRRGAVSPLGLPTPIDTLVDKSVLTQEEISIGSGHQGAVVILKQVHLINAHCEPEVIDVLNSE